MLRIITNLKILKLMLIVVNVPLVDVVLISFVHFYSKIYKTNDDIESEELVKGIHNTILEIIKKREEKVMTGEGSSFGGDFLQLLVEAHHDANASLKISIEDLVDECKTFYIAGQETTSTLLAWTIFLLAIHTDWQEKARKEVLNLFGQQNPNPDGITKLKTVRMSQTQINY